MAPDNKNDNNGIESPASAGHHWLKRALITFAAILTIVGATLAWVINDTDRVRKVIETLVTDLTDRPFHIRGEFDFELGREISVSATDIEWVNAPWSSQPTMLSVEKANVSVSLKSLLYRPIVITDAVASNARLDFEWNADSVSNWYLVKKDRPPSTEPLHPLPLLLDKADLRNVELHFKHPALTEELVISIDKATQQQDEENLLVLEIDSIISGRKLNIDGRIGPFPELVIAGAVKLDIQVKGPFAEASIKGDIENLAALKNPHLDFRFSTQEIASVLDVLNLPPVTQGKAELLAGIKSEGDAIAASAHGQLGEFNVDGDFKIASMTDLRGISADLKSDGPSARVAFGTIGLNGMPPEPYALDIVLKDSKDGLRIDSLDFESAGAKVTGSGLIHDFPKLEDLDFQLRANTEDLSRFSDLLPDIRFPKEPLSLIADIKSNADGSKDLLDSKIRLGNLSASISGKLTEDPRFVGSEFSFSANVPDAQQLGNIVKLPLTRQASMAVEGTATVNRDSINLDVAKGNIGANSIDGNLSLPTNGATQALQFSAKASGTDLADLVGLFANSERVPAMPYNLRGNFALVGKQLDIQALEGMVGQTDLKTSGKINLASADSVIDLSIHADGKNLDEVLRSQGLEDGPAKPFSLDTKFAMADGGVTLSGINFSTEDDKLRGSLAFSGLQDTPRVTFDLTASGKNLQSIAPKIPNYIPAPVQFDIRAKGILDKSTVDIPELTAKLGQATAKVRGKIDLPPELKATNLTFDISGPDITDLGEIASRRFAKNPFSLSATMQGSASSLHVSDFAATVGKNDLKGKLDLDLTAKPNLELTGTSKRLDISELQSEFEKKATDDKDAPTIKSAAAGKDERLIPDTALPFELLNKVDGSININVQRFVSTKIDLGSVQVVGQLKDGDLEISRFAAKTDRGKLESKIRLQQNNNKPTLEVQATAINLVLAFGQLDDYLRKNHPGQNIDLYLATSGNTYRQLAGNLNGFVWLRGGEREIRAGDLDFLLGDFLTEVFTAMNPFAKKEPYQMMECDRLFLEATDGILQTSPAIFLRTDKLNMTAVGAINLHTEKIDIAIQTTPRSGIGISASDLVNPFIKIGGTLANPGLTLDAKGTLIEGGAAVATMGLTIVAKSMYKRWLWPKQSCQTLTEEARKIRSERDPKHVPAD